MQIKGDWRNQLTSCWTVICPLHFRHIASGVRFNPILLGLKDTWLTRVPATKASSAPPRFIACSLLHHKTQCLVQTLQNRCFSPPPPSLPTPYTVTHRLSHSVPIFPYLRWFLPNFRNQVLPFHLSRLYWIILKA